MNPCDGIIPENFRDAILASLKGDINVKEAAKRFDVPSRSVRNAIEQLNLVNKMRGKSQQPPLIKNEKRRQIYRRPTKIHKGHS